MKLRRITALAVALLLTVSLSGCKELPMENYTALTAEPQTVIVGETLTITVPLPTEKAEGLAAVVTDGTSPAISADYTAPNLVITGISEGNAEVQIEFSAGWLYKKSNITIPVTSLLPQLEATIVEGSTDSSYDFSARGSFVLYMDGDSTYEIATDEKNSLLTAKSADSGTVELTVEGYSLNVHPVKPGRTTLDLVLTKDGFRDAKMTCDIEVKAIPTLLSLPEETSPDVKLENGKSVVIAPTYEGDLSVISDNPSVTAKIENGKLKLTGTAEGTAKVTVSAKKEHYLDSTLELNCTVTAAAPPAAPPAAPAVPSGPYADIISDIVKYTNIERASMGLPALKLSNTLSGAAAIRAKETATEQSHTRPDGRRGLTAIQDAGLGSYDAEGENLSGSSVAEDGEAIVARWMASPAHRDAILLPQFKTIGVGVYYDDDMYRYCQLFTGTKLK